MSDVPDPPNGDAGAIEINATAEFFLRRYLGIAADAPIPVDNPTVQARIKDLARIESEDTDRLKTEFEAHPMQNYAALDADTRVTEIQKVFPNQTIEKVSDDSNKVRINGLIEYDATALRRMAPSQRDKIFEVSKMPESTPGEIAAKQVEVKNLVGKLRLRVPKLAEDGRDHLRGMLNADHRAALADLYGADATTIEDQYRAWDILNKINAGDSEAVQQRERERQADTMAFAMDLSPTDLRDMVECFEFADLDIGRRIKENALEKAIARQEQDYEERKENVRAKPLRLARKIQEWEEEMREQEGILAQHDKDSPEGKAAQKQIKICESRLKGIRAAKKKADDIDPDQIPRETAPTSGSKAEKDKAREEVLASLRENPVVRAAMLEQMQQTFAQYVEAVTMTGNTAGTTPCQLVLEDILPNASAAQSVADNLRFGSNRAAAYHTLKHFKEISPGDQTKKNFGTETENQVGNYHLSARATVSKGDCAKSAVGQNGGESHHFKGNPCTAIVWLDGTNAGLATYFNI